MVDRSHKKDSLFVTPVGICINYYTQKNNFIYVTVNGERIKLYDNNSLTVIDAIMQSGYPNELLFPRRGMAVNYTLNSVARMVRGEAGEPARILKNGKEANMSMQIEKNDYIDIVESTVGEAGKLAIGSLPEYKSQIEFSINGKQVKCPKFAYVNGTLQPPSYIIKENDSVVMENYYTVSQLFEFLDIPLDGVIIKVNNEDAGPDTKVYENFNVRYDEIEEEPVIVDEEGTPEEIPAAVRDKEPADNTSIQITVNNTPVTLKNKTRYTLVDVLDFYPFDLSKMGGTELYTAINGVKSGFTDQVRANDSIDIYWIG